MQPMKKLKTVLTALFLAFSLLLKGEAYKHAIMESDSIKKPFLDKNMF